MSIYLDVNLSRCLPIYSSIYLFIQKHIEEEYSVVGILEDLNQTMTLFENYIPGKL